MTSFAPTLIAPAPCRPIPLVRNSRHQHHTSRYARLSISSTSSRRSSGGSHHKHSQSGSIGSDAAFGFTLSSTASATSPPPVSALAPPQSAMLTPLQEVQRFDPSAPTATPKIDHDLTPTRKNMQAYSSTLSSQPVNPASPPSSALASPFLAVPLPSSTSSSNNISQTPSSNSHPTLIPPSPIPRRLTRNPFVRSLSQQHTVTTNTVQLGLGLGFGSDSQHIGQDPTTPTQPTHSSADPFLLRPSLQEDEPAHRFSMDNIGIGLMEIDFDLDNFSADDGGRELLRVERERRKRSFEMHS